MAMLSYEDTMAVYIEIETGSKVEACKKFSMMTGIKPVSLAYRIMMEDYYKFTNPTGSGKTESK